MAKRPFQRVGGNLIDEYEDPPGVKQRSDLPESLLRQADDALAKAASPGPAIDRSPERIASLIERLREGNIEALTQLSMLLDEPQVVPAIIDAARKCRAEHRDYFAQVLGFIGGPEATELLEAQLSEVASDPHLMVADPVTNWSALSATLVAEALIRLDASNHRAAEVLVRLFAHPGHVSRRYAIRLAGSCFRPLLASTPAHSVLRRGLLPLIDDPAHDIFLSAAPAFWLRERERAYPRWEKLLHHEDPRVRQAAVDTLGHLQNEFRALAAVLSWIPKEPSLGVATYMALSLRELLPREMGDELIRRCLADESPTHRLSALSLLRDVDSNRRVELAQPALADEPDPYLKAQLAKLVAAA